MADRFPGEQPRFDQPVVDQSGRVTQAWANYFLRLASVQASDDLRALYEALAARVAALEEGEGASFQILGQQSVSVNGVPQPGHVVIITLQGDADSPGNTTYYGTGPTGAKGWFPVSGAITVSSGELTKTVGADGVTTFGLANVADSGAGALLAITRDGKGRVTGTKAATITGTAQQIDVANGNAAAGMPTLELASEVLDSLGKADSAVQEVRPGTNVTVDNTDPRRPIVSAMGTPDGYIDGFKLSYSGAGQVSVSSGNAYVPSVGGIVSALPSAPSVSVGTNAFGHVYLRADGSTEVDSTSPSAAYSGTARTKTGDSSCRYLGTVLTDSLGDVYMFMHVGAQITYMVTLENAPFRVLANGQQTTAATVSVASIVPTTSSIANFGITNIDAAVAALINSGAFAYTSNPNSFAAIPVPLDASNSFNYNYIVTPAGGLYVDCLGYYFER